MEDIYFTLCHRVLVLRVFASLYLEKLGFTVTLLSGYLCEYRINEKDTSIFLPLGLMIVYYYAKNFRSGLYQHQKVQEYMEEIYYSLRN